MGDVYRDLAARDDLRPGPEVDGLFGRLVRLVLTAPAETVPAVLNDVGVQQLAPRLRALCAQGEGELEHAWAKRIVAGCPPREELARFPYFGNYRQLSRMEIGILASALPRRVRSVAFVGSGPLPLSSLYLAGELDASLDNYDRDPVALTAGARVAGALGYGELGFHEADVLDADLSGYDVVVLAALVGDTLEAKRRILGHLAGTMRPGAVLLARSARGLRTLLYPPIDRTALDGFEPLTEVHPVNDVINSAILARAGG
ncbi:nicotianamine synthase family protein [Jiangella endophytica]|uniref:nicotianamine synthase family protein n=1 Tax=Jiangella endophytica TaxID=1623398 RepID=UPI0013002375|nr:nicotianamine synthase family protein [Jiangella endophytica]